MAHNNETCQNCDFCRADEGRCYRFPPLIYVQPGTLTSDTAPQIITAVPEVEPTTKACGEFNAAHP